VDATHEPVIDFKPEIVVAKQQLQAVPKTSPEHVLYDPLADEKGHEIPRFTLVVKGVEPKIPPHSLIVIVVPEHV
jgi:hypothetical protein